MTWEDELVLGCSGRSVARAATATELVDVAEIASSLQCPSDLAGGVPGHGCEALARGEALELRVGVGRHGKQDGQVGLHEHRLSLVVDVIPDRLLPLVPGSAHARGSGRVLVEVEGAPQGGCRDDELPSDLDQPGDVATAGSVVGGRPRQADGHAGVGPEGHGRRVLGVGEPASWGLSVEC